MGNGAGEFGKYTAEYQVGQVGGDPLLVETAFFERTQMKGTRVGLPGEKGLPAEEQDEQLQSVAALGLGECEEVVVVAWKIEDGRQVDLEELL